MARALFLANILKQIVQTANVDQNSYFIIGSYALRKHKDVTDLDIVMLDSEFEKLRNLPFGAIEIYNNQTRYFYAPTDDLDYSIEIFSKKADEGYPNSNFSLNSLRPSLQIDEFKHQHFSLQQLLDWKLSMNRPKDQADIEMLKLLC